jgi:hypothetical protein
VDTVPSQSTDPVMVIESDPGLVVDTLKVRFPESTVYVPSEAPSPITDKTLIAIPLQEAVVEVIVQVPLAPDFAKSRMIAAEAGLAITSIARTLARTTIFFIVSFPPPTILELNPGALEQFRSQKPSGL